MSLHDADGDRGDLWRALRAERVEREAALKQLGDVLAEQLEAEVAALHKRIDEVHERALRELTRLHAGGATR